MKMIKKSIMVIGLFCAYNAVEQNAYAQNPFGTTQGTTQGIPPGAAASSNLNPAQIASDILSNVTIGVGNVGGKGEGFVCTQNGQGIFVCKIGLRPSYNSPPASGIGATINDINTSGFPISTIPPEIPFVMPPYNSTGGGLSNTPQGPYNGSTVGIVGGSNGSANSQANDRQDITTTRTPFLSSTAQGIGGGAFTRYYLQAASASTLGCRSSSKIDSLYIRNIDFNYRFITIVGPVDYIEMLPFESASYKFTVPMDKEGFKEQLITESAAQATHVGFSISISEQPCDFEVNDPNNTYKRPSDGLVGKTCLKENANFPSIYWQVTSNNQSRAINSDYYTCRLTPGKTYYINIKHAAGANNDLCYDHNISVGNSPGNFKVCGGIVKFQ